MCQASEIPNNCSNKFFKSNDLKLESRKNYFQERLFASLHNGQHRQFNDVIKNNQGNKRSFFYTISQLIIKKCNTFFFVLPYFFYNMNESSYI